MSGHEQRDGDWRVICSLSGFKGWASDCVKLWNGTYALRRFAGSETQRHPQELPYTPPVAEGRVPWAQPQGADVFADDGWTPLSLGAALLAWWDAEATSSLILAGSAITSWADVKGGYALTQATGSMRPTYASNSLNARPAATFDGVDDYLSMESAPFPIGAVGSEIWSLVNQTSTPVGNRVLAAYGGSSTTNRRAAQRSVTASTSRLRTDVGIGAGASAATASNTNVVFDGIHVTRSIIRESNVTSDIDGDAGASSTAVPATVATRTRIGANTSDTASAFWQGPINSILITTTLGASNAALLLAYLKARGGIA